MNDVIKMTRDAIGLKGIDMEDNGEKIPKASKTIDVKKVLFMVKAKQ